MNRPWTHASRCAKGSPMLRRVFAAAVLSWAPLCFGQASPSLALTPSAKDAAPNLIKDAGFEEPQVTQRTSVTGGGNPATAEESKSDWAHFQVFQQDRPGEGKLSIGLTNEFAHGGKQSVFVDFEKVTAVNRRSFLMSRLLPVKPANTYRIGIWGRTDGKRPLTLDQRVALMKVEVEYFTPDTDNQAGDTDNRTLLIPGSAKRIFFSSNKWTEYLTKVRTPRDAGWMKVTFRWETGRDAGTTDGTIYFDDASATLMVGEESIIPVDESDAAKSEPEEAEAPAEETKEPVKSPAPPK